MLWVKASIYKPDTPNSLRVAYVKFDVNLSSGKRYMLNRELKGKSISIWIQDHDTGDVVSDVKTKELNYYRFKASREQLPKCKAGSI
ncbi:hypothetical protein [Thalassotalea agarivorans]|uniref:Uncharacterized protein n=1 Tax=Thalassotalea agarivorans TaxID=349064 RepID=A0A1I0DC60_THASX|nr:hypothetical protein [Thalassotalea agarivorans]SET29708.1 hypothetical protein SAMN05660429_01452 [Thalassotalea agarivorans]